MMRLPVHIWIREENASSKEIAGYFVELARRLDAKPQRMRLVIESTVPVSIDFAPSDGNPVVSVGDETTRFDIRRRWIPEHPVPLNLGPDPMLEGAVAIKRRRTVLLIDPVDGNRFRVRDRHEVAATGGWAYALFALAAVAFAVTLHPVALAATILVALLLVMKWLLKW